MGAVSCCGGPARVYSFVGVDFSLGFFVFVQLVVVYSSCATWINVCIFSKNHDDLHRVTLG